MATDQQILEEWQSLEPIDHQTVMTLLEQAGHDVSYWTRNEDGSTVRTPAANPNYCYDWAFGSPSEQIVFCVWYRDIEVDSQDVVQRGNALQLGRSLASMAADGSRDTQVRNRSRQQARRAHFFDSLVKEAFLALLPVRLILNKGVHSDESELGSAPPEVTARILDPEPWFVHRYDEHTGQYVMIRGKKPSSDLETRESDAAAGNDEDERQLAAIKVRRGQANFRERLLTAWKSKCVVTMCGVIGLLEAAHIKPHAEEVDYRTCNGLLLRADIHTLFDLGLLSIDEFMRVHLDDSLKYSEYWQLNGKQIDRRPDVGSDAPSISALRARHHLFNERRRLD